MRLLAASELVGGFTADPFLLAGCGAGACIAAYHQRMWPLGILAGIFLLIDFMTDWP